ncbi:hypothetical protein [Actinokineospora sp. HUAS TT18]|uniref:hypothetical protein n=1 Tax=Actinokineospora sp. HUAS TT18 TaxID=3447451 RepID=UPI003F526BAC
MDVEAMAALMTAVAADLGHGLHQPGVYVSDRVLADGYEPLFMPPRSRNSRGASSGGFAAIVRVMYRVGSDCRE